MGCGGSKDAATTATPTNNSPQDLLTQTKNNNQTKETQQKIKEPEKITDSPPVVQMEAQNQITTTSVSVAPESIPVIPVGVQNLTESIPSVPDESLPAATNEFPASEEQLIPTEEEPESEPIVVNPQPVDAESPEDEPRPENIESIEIVVPVTPTLIDATSPAVSAPLEHEISTISPHLDVTPQIEQDQVVGESETSTETAHQEISETTSEPIVVEPESNPIIEINTEPEIESTSVTSNIDPPIGPSVETNPVVEIHEPISTSESEIDPEHTITTNPEPSLPDDLTPEFEVETINSSHSISTGITESNQEHVIAASSGSIVESEQQSTFPETKSVDQTDVVCVELVTPLETHVETNETVIKLESQSEISEAEAETEPEKFVTDEVLAASSHQQSLQIDPTEPDPIEGKAESPSIQKTVNLQNESIGSLPPTSPVLQHAASAPLPPRPQSPPSSPFTHVRSLSTLPPQAHYGWLTKQGHVIRNWKRRYFTLEAGLLRYYVDDSLNKLQGELPLKKMVVSQPERNRLLLQVQPGASFADDEQKPVDLLMESPSIDDAARWVVILNEHIQYANKNPTSTRKVKRQGSIWGG